MIVTISTLGEAFLMKECTKCNSDFLWDNAQKITIAKLTERALKRVKNYLARIPDIDETTH